MVKVKVRSSSSRETLRKRFGKNIEIGAFKKISPKIFEVNIKKKRRV